MTSAQPVPRRPAAETAPELDEGFERLAHAGFELPNGFVNHGPMACEALAAMGLIDDIGQWANRFSRYRGTAVPPRAPIDFHWRDALGDYERLPEWMGLFERAIADDGWPSVVAVWVPRLLPGLATRLFHGAIRSGHAVRAIAAADTEPRRAELARALGYWAARFSPGQPTSPGDDPLTGDLRMAVTAEAAEGARRYLTQPSILNLHGVTGAMAVELFADHLPAGAAAGALAQVQAEHRALYAHTPPASTFDLAGVDEPDLAVAAEVSGDPHQVKLVEACRRGLALTGDPVFAAAAETVTSLT
jgi:hypothetical protein